MRVAHFDCFNGASGDMVLGALFDAGVSVDAVRAALDSLGLPITLEVTKLKRGGFACTQATVHAEDQEDYRFLPDVEAILAKGDLSEPARQLALTIFARVAHAESVAHGMPLEKVHFHEVGALDSIADIVGAAVGLTLLEVEAFTCSSVPTGFGTVKCAHGVMPVPTPGTAELLKGVPLAASQVKGELTTPTGAAILTALKPTFTDSPAMTIQTIGVGCGTKDFIDRPNILRLFLGETADSSESDTVVVLETNLDDVAGEIIGFVSDELMRAGALDVFSVAIQMKKSRPGVLLSVIAAPADAERLETILFRETATFGIRRSTLSRHKFARELSMVETPWGPVRAKIGRRSAVEVCTPEYEECARVAREQGVPLRVIYDAVRSAGVRKSNFLPSPSKE